MTDPLPVRMVFGKGGVRVEYEEKKMTAPTLRELVANADFADAAIEDGLARLTDLEAVVKVARKVMERIKVDLKVTHYNCGCDYCALGVALERVK